MLSLRKLVISSDLCLGTSFPSNEYSPAVGLSRAAIQFRSVVFPEPDGPNNTIRSPFSITKSIPSSAFTTSDAIS